MRLQVPDSKGVGAATGQQRLARGVADCLLRIRARKHGSSRRQTVNVRSKRNGVTVATKVRAEIVRWSKGAPAEDQSSFTT